jgi:hypothetical protein
LIATLFNLTTSDVSRYCFQVRVGLKEFIADNLVAKRMSREEWINHNTLMVNELFLENKVQLVLIADGTFCFCKKAQNNEFQRLTYSGSKKRHLVKPFEIFSSDGTIVDIYGFM